MPSPVTPSVACAAKRLGVVLIGQGPRPDIADQLGAVMPGVELDIRGALDGLSLEEIQAVKPASGAEALIALLPPERRGTTPETAGMVVSKKLVEKQAGGVLRRLADDGAYLSIMFCAGDFPGLRAGVRTVIPSRIMSSVIDGLLPEGRLGVFMPLAEQREHFRSVWTRPGREVVAVPLLPGASESGLREAAREMAESAPDLVVMDCMGYTRRMKAQVEETLDVPVMLTFNTVLSFVREMFAD